MVRLMTLEQAVRDSLAADTAPVTERDQAVAELALTYARELDGHDPDTTKLGPALLACLDALLLTPRARAAALRNGASDGAKPVSPLDQLRERRARRDGAETVDPAPA